MRDPAGALSYLANRLEDFLLRPIRQRVDLTAGELSQSGRELISQRVS